MMLLAVLLGMSSLFLLILMAGLFMEDPVAATLSFAFLGAICYYSWKSNERNKRNKKGIWADTGQQVAGRSTPTLIHHEAPTRPPQERFTHNALDDLDDEDLE